MPTARELNQKIGMLPGEWSSFLAEAHRLVNQADLSAELNSVINTLAIPSPYTTPEQRIKNAITYATQIQTRMRENIAKLRTFLTA